MISLVIVRINVHLQKWENNNIYFTISDPVFLASSFCQSTKCHHTLFTPLSRRSHGTWGSVFTREQTFITSVHRSPYVRWQAASRCTISERPTNTKLICSSNCLYLFSWQRRRRRQRWCCVRAVSSWWLELVSLQRLCTAVRKPSHLLTWCMHTCQSCHLPSIANPFQRECCYAARQSNAAREQMCVLHGHVLYLWTWRGDKYDLSPSGDEELHGLSACSQVCFHLTLVSERFHPVSRDGLVSCRKWSCAAVGG